MENTTMFRGSVFYELWMACDTAEEKAELRQAIMEYGLFWKEPPQKFKLIFVNIKFILNRSKEISEERRKAWKNHTWNQYTKWDEKRKDNSEAQTNGVEQMEQMEQDGTNGTNQNSNSLSTSSTSSKRIEKKKEKEKRKEEMLERFRKDDRLTPYMDEDYVVKRWDFKEGTKKPYKDVDSFITMLVARMNKIKKYWWKPKSDMNRRNRFKFMVDRAIGKQWDWIDWYDSMEQEYEDSKDDLYPNPVQNE